MIEVGDEVTLLVKPPRCAKYRLGERGTVLSLCDGKYRVSQNAPWGKTSGWFEKFEIITDAEIAEERKKMAFHRRFKEE